MSCQWFKYYSQFVWLCCVCSFVGCNDITVAKPFLNIDKQKRYKEDLEYEMKYDLTQSNLEGYHKYVIFSIFKVVVIK